MVQMRVLLVEDDDVLRQITAQALESKNFEVVAATNVTEALVLIVTQPFDVLVTDLHMPGAGDGFTLVSAMHHSQPKALTLVLSGYPDIQKAMETIVLQADDVLVKPFKIAQLAELIHKKTQDRTPSAKQISENVATILERDASITIDRWLSRVRENEDLNVVILEDAARARYLLEFMADILSRLRNNREIECGKKASTTATAHGQLRYLQGYTAPMIVQESRILQVCIFETIKRNLGTVNFSEVMPDIMLIADEVDSQLTESIDSFLKAAEVAAAA